MWLLPIFLSNDWSFFFVIRRRVFIATMVVSPVYVPVYVAKGWT